MSISPPSSSSNNSEDSISHRRRQVVEDDITARFFTAFSQRMERLIEAKNFEDFAISKEEISIITNACTFMSYRGFAAGATSLALLRGYRAGMFGRMTRVMLFRPKPSSPVASPTTATSTWSSDRLNYMFLWGLDITTSSVIGLGVLIHSAASGKVFQDMAKVPLLPGRSSAISRQYCEASVQEYQNMRRDYTKSQNTVALEVLQSPQTGNLRGFLELCRNCQKRQIHESRLRQQQNIIVDDSPVCVPSPGVPEDIHIIEEEEEEENADEDASSSNSSCIIM
jgi:hypothetical protein